jgi:transglutaminase-like putative cysteine protease
VSPRLPEEPPIAAYAREVLKPGQTVREIAAALCARIHGDFTYDSEATTVDTTPRESFQLKRGVCQDFAHIMIVALRSLGIPAGYVSGFLRTIPPPGKERLEGADAMHAWVRVWCGDTMGYIEFDPTNNIPAGSDHIVVGYGRDYSDVAPVIGVLKGYGNQKIIQAVDVVPLK